MSDWQIVPSNRRTTRDVVHIVSRTDGHIATDVRRDLAERIVTDHNGAGSPAVKPYSDAGVILSDQTYVGMQTRLRLVVRVPAPQAKPGGDLPADFEPAIRQAVANALEDLTVNGMTVDYVAVEQFDDSEV